MARKLFYLFLFIPAISFSQGQGNIWHFGDNAGIDFNSGTAVAIQGFVNTTEGCASICNSAGALLFSTDGITVYNNVGGVLASGLNGDPSSSQSGVIVPFPGAIDKYYIFTADATTGAAGICYSVIDMNLNAGLGGAVSINTQLITPACEKITAIRNSNGTDYWVVVHAFPSDEFYAYPVTAAGVGTPIVTAIGLPINGSANTIGYLKSSPNGQMLAAGRCFVANDPIELFDFDASTGILSNYIPIPSIGNAYGISFSPDNSKLYIGYNDLTGINIEQFDLSITNFQNFPYTVIQGTGVYHYALQLAPDGKIYCSKYSETTLGVINNPNQAGIACNYDDFGFTLFPGTTAMVGLPNFIDNFFTPITCNVNLGNDTMYCGNFSQTLNAGSSDSLILWSNGSTNQTITIDTAGIYWVVKTLAGGCVATDTIIITQHPETTVWLGDNAVACNPGDITLDAGAGFALYHWSNSTDLQTLTPLTTGNYFIQVMDTNGCFDMDTISVLFLAPSINIGNNTAICVNDSLQLNAGSGFVSYEWSTGSVDSSIMIYSAGTYFVSVKDSFACTAYDTIIISLSTPAINIGTDTLFCNAFNYSITAGSGFANYHWQNNSSNSTYIITSAGLYSVTVTDIYGCTAADAITVLNNLPQVSIGNDTVICINTSATITATTGFDNYMWNTGSSVENIVAATSGVYSVTVTDSEGCTTADYKNISVNNPALFIGNDTSTCNGNGIMLDAGNSFVNYLWSNNSGEQLIITNGAGIYSVTVTDFYGCNISDEATITYSNCVDIIVPTGFTPNGDGLNNFFHILNASDFKSAEIKIYNRWGQLLFESNDANASWNGKYNGEDCEVGVYVFVISGKNYLELAIFKNGNITLLR